MQARSALDFVQLPKLNATYKKGKISSAVFSFGSLHKDYKVSSITRDHYYYMYARYQARQERNPNTGQSM